MWIVTKLQANVVPEVIGKIKRHPIKSKNIKVELIKYELADNLLTTIEIKPIDVLIRNDYYTDIASMKRIEIKDTLHLLRSRIGWILTVRTKRNGLINKIVWMLANSTSIFSQFEAFSKDSKSIINSMQRHIEEYWKPEAIGVKEPWVETESEKAPENFN